MPTRREFLGQAIVASVLGSTNSPAAQPNVSRGAARNDPMQSFRVPNTDLMVSRIAYGTGFLQFDWSNPNYVSDALPAIRTAYESGITLFDLADVYGYGGSELAMGRVLKDVPGMRERIVIQTKCGLRIPNNWRPGVPILGTDLSYKNIVRAAEGSLKRLGTDRVDIYQLHAPDALMEPEEVARAFDELSSSGKVRYFGLSNHGMVQTELIRKAVRQPIVVNQISLGLGNYAAIGGRPTTDGIVDYCRMNNIQVQAYSPIRGGFLKPAADASPQMKQVAQLLADLANQHQTNTSAIALAWLLRHPAHIVPVIGSSRQEYIVENCAADRVSLSNEEWHALFIAAAGIQRTKNA